jgi:hypothetical protein
VFFISFFIGREREKREREKKIGGAGKTHFVSRKFLPKTKEEEREEFWFLIPRGALALFIILQNFIRAYHDRE